MKGAMKHPGFEGAAQSVAAKEHLPMKNAEAIIAAGAHKASAAAKAKNPNLKRVKGAVKRG